MKVLREIWWQIVWFFEGLCMALTYEDDPELWDNPRKRERILLVFSVIFASRVHQPTLALEARRHSPKSLAICSQA